MRALIHADAASPSVAVLMPPPLRLQGTWPTGIKAPLMDEGDFECLDYVYIWTAPDYSVRWATDGCMGSLGVVQGVPGHVHGWAAPGLLCQVGASGSDSYVVGWSRVDVVAGITHAGQAAACPLPPFSHISWS